MNEMDENFLRFEWTGERYIPEVHGQIELEHMHRYAFARQFVQGKIVLDIACGEGYGTAMLSMMALQVVGVDISMEVINYARKRYVGDNITFKRGSCTKIPLKDCSVEVVVSFETIEHHDQHEAMMSEIKRVLKPNGILVISSPEKYEYSILPEYKNPYHVKELYRDEFETLISSYFKFQKILGQKIIYGSAILCEDEKSHLMSYRTIDGYNKKYDGVPNPKYLIAVASNESLPTLYSGFLDQPIHECEEIKWWSSNAVEKEKQIESLYKTIAERTTQIEDLNKQIEDLNKSMNNVQDQLTIILNSKSWLLTKPFRDFRSMFSNGKFKTSLRNMAYSAWHQIPLTIQSKQKLKYIILNRLNQVFERDAELENLDFYSTSKYVSLLNNQPLTNKPIKLICFYLPQFHSIPENDKWWGEGFTEWRNVRSGQPQFIGHYQPHVPGDLGYYSLLESEVQRKQIELAKLYGIEGFCFYFYWFGGKTLLEAPIKNYLRDSSLDLPFCLCWANENWNRRWDGLENEILIAQKHSSADDLAFIKHVAQYLRDPRYIRINEKPLLIVYRPGLLPSAKDTALRWRTWCRKEGIGEIYLCYTQSFEALDPVAYGFDAAIEFPPNNSKPVDVTRRLKPLNKSFRCIVYDYRSLVQQYENKRQHHYRLFRTVCPSWDNTARRRNQSTIFLNNTPVLYERWLENAIRSTINQHTNIDERIVFINAWNEWAEGNHLEPDQRYGYAWLQATRDAIVHAAAGEAMSILLVSHDCHPHGAQLLILEIAKQLKTNGFKVSILALEGGKLFDDFAQVGECINATKAGKNAIDDFLQKLRSEGNLNAITSTVVSGHMVPQLKEMGFRVLSLVHELPRVINDLRQQGNAAKIMQYADKVVFPAEMVYKRFGEVVRLDPSKAIIRPQGVIRRNPYKNRRADAHRFVCEKHNLPAGTQIVLSIAYVDKRKGPDLFVEIANKVLRQRQHTVFIWIGHADPEMADSVNAQISELNLQDKVIFIGFEREPLAYYAAASVYALTSREDPFPNVVLESAEAGVPVVAFQKVSGASDFIIQHGGRLAAYMDTDDFAQSICELLEKPRIKTPEVVGSMQQYVLDLVHHLTGFKRVSVVVPNYNYERHIRKRLDSIYSQSYPIYEVIILDDASTDNSLKVIHEHLQQTGREAQVVVNHSNSGSVFRQWQKGVSLCKGDLVWIAEADDLADSGFLDHLCGAFDNPEIVLAYAQSKQIDTNGNIIAEDYLDYTKDISKWWEADYVRNGHEEIAQALTIKNTIPNVSAVLFRRTDLEKIIEAIGEELFNYRVAGDWLVYLNILKNGAIYYCKNPLNLHRRHNDSVTNSAQQLRHIHEVAKLQAISRIIAPPSDEVIVKANNYLRQLHAQFGIPFQEMIV